MVKQKVRVKVLSGIHFRPAGKITEKALQYESNVKSFLNLLAACIKCGDEIEIRCEGPDEKEALEEIVKMFEDTNLGREEGPG